MPSLVESLGAQLRQVGADLPLAELVHAADRLRAAAARCDHVMRDSRHAEWLAQLTAAGEYLNSAIAVTTSVLDGLDGYLTGIGLAGMPHEVTAPAPATVYAGTGSTASREDPALAMRAWWAERVDLITGRSPEPRRAATVRDDGADERGTPEDPAGALRRLARAAAAASPDGYREQLLATHPAAGLRIAAPAARAGRYLATDLLGHPAGPDDHAALAQRCHPDRVRELMPRIDERLAAALLAELCGSAGPRGAADAGSGGDSQRRHPVDSAAAWPVLTAGLLRAAGRDDEALAELTAVADQQPDDTVRRDGR